MTPARWERLKGLFHGALAQSPETRQAWLAREAEGDEELVQEAMALLVSHETVGDFLETAVVFDPSDIAAPLVDTGPSPLDRIGPYEIERQLDGGGMSVVYRALDTRLNRRVALKALPSVHEDDVALRERLRREAQAVATISHPSVATVYALEDIEGRLYISSEFVEGHTLRRVIEESPVERTRAFAIAADIVRGLIAVHRAGVIHRDLKPENVMITPAGAVKVVDFGIARLERLDAARLTQDGALLGTPAYMAPEQLLGGAIDARVDIYALGVMLSEMLTGSHPLVRGHAAATQQTSGIARRCMEPDPDHRYHSAQQLLADLEREIRSGARTEAGGSSRWWWEFHQGAAALIYGAMTWPAWIARGVIGGSLGNAIFVAVLSAAIVASALRLNLWFTSRSDPDELGWSRQRVARPLLAADWIFLAALMLGGALVGERNAAIAILLIAVGTGTGVAFLLIEPATARAAFRDRTKQ